jgi:hypothetical protein
MPHGPQPHLPKPSVKRRTAGRDRGPGRPPPAGRAPCRELMLALCRTGRPADAVARYRLFRHELAEHLGADPNTGPQQLYQQIVTADPVRAATERRAAGVPVADAPAAALTGSRLARCDTTSMITGARLVHREGCRSGGPDRSPGHDGGRRDRAARPVRRAPGIRKGGRRAGRGGRADPAVRGISARRRRSAATGRPSTCSAASAASTRAPTPSANPGHPYLALGRPGEARAVWREAWDFYRRQGREPDAERVRARMAALDWGDLQGAVDPGR